MNGLIGPLLSLTSYLASQDMRLAVGNGAAVNINLCRRASGYTFRRTVFSRISSSTCVPPEARKESRQLFQGAALAVDME